jgi:hypothetical protein
VVFAGSQGAVRLRLAAWLPAGTGSGGARLLPAPIARGLSCAKIAGLRRPVTLYRSLVYFRDNSGFANF